MDLIGWSLNAIDQIFSTRKMGKGEPACPDGTFAAGYMMDSWKEWRPVTPLYTPLALQWQCIGLWVVQGHRQVKRAHFSLRRELAFCVCPCSVGISVSPYLTLKTST